MKIILAGTTGRIGTAVLQHCLTTPQITQIYALTRRPLSQTHDKLTNIIQPDFTTYPSSIIEQLRGAEACIWSLGVVPSKGEGVWEKYHEVDVTYSMAAARAFMELGQGKFRMVFVSGAGAERDQEKSLWRMGVARQVKGLAETQLEDLAKQNSDKLEVVIARAGLMVDSNIVLADFMLRAGFMIRATHLAAALVELATKGNAKGGIVYAADLNDLGKAVYEKKLLES